MRGAELESRDANRETPLRWAIRRRKLAATATLIKFGASLQKADGVAYKKLNYENALKLAVMNATIEAARTAREMEPAASETS